MDDTYLTIVSSSQGIYKDKGSKFLSFAFPVSSVEEAMQLIDGKRKEYHDARHVCYAYMLGKDRINFRTNDDGEPSGTAGKPILGQINSKQLTDILIVVVRYFGGVLLGTGGLILAYKNAAMEALAVAKIEQRVVERTYTVMFDYAAMNEVMRVIKDNQLTICSQTQTEKCKLLIAVRQSIEEQVVKRLSQIRSLKIE
ncbi:MAG: IMPACT family protein [Paludibacteraceae bacterium]|nr:IMPACT family protein [Paludibacteraceae bacterium]